MLTVRLDLDMEKRLTNLSKETHRNKSFYVKKAIENFLNEYEESLRILSIKERLHSGQEKTYTLEDVQKMYGLEP